jgi:hypothetical protein
MNGTTLMVNFSYAPRQVSNASSKQASRTLMTCFTKAALLAMRQIGSI